MVVAETVAFTKPSVITKLCDSLFVYVYFKHKQIKDTNEKIYTKSLLDTTNITKALYLQRPGGVYTTGPAPNLVNRAANSQ